jgi:hypothetical protein
MRKCERCNRLEKERDEAVEANDHYFEVFTEIKRRLCPPCYEGIPVNDEGEHFYKSGGLIWCPISWMGLPS